MDLRPKLCLSNGELGWKIGRRAAAQTVAAAREPLVLPLLVVGRGFSGVMGVFFGTGLGMSATQMHRSVRVAANKRQRQQDDQASDP
jgi:hypothetical protein